MCTDILIVKTKGNLDNLERGPEHNDSMTKKSWDNWDKVIVTDLNNPDVFNKALSMLLGLILRSTTLALWIYF